MYKYSSYSNNVTKNVPGLKSYVYTTATNHICNIRGAKWLKFNPTTCVLALSLDNGVTYPNTLNLTGVLDIIQYSKIFTNGNIMFCSQTKIFYSTDNLSTYHESTVLDINGNTYVPNTYNNFKGLSYHKQINLASGNELIVWANYSTSYFDNSNVWYTIDGGITVKSAFARGTSLGGADYRHIDCVNYNQYDNSWWITTGDSGYCKWVKGLYDQNTDTWTWELYNEGDEWHMTGLSFDGTYCYLGSDTVGLSDYFGVWRIPYSNMKTPKEQWEQVIDIIRVWGCYTDFGNGLIIAAEAGVHIFHLSFDYGATWDDAKTLIGGPDISTFFGGWYFGPVGPSEDNFYKVEIQESYTIELDKDSPSGIVLLIQVIHHN